MKVASLKCQFQNPNDEKRRNSERKRQFREEIKLGLGWKDVIREYKREYERLYSAVL